MKEVLDFSFTRFPPPITGPPEQPGRPAAADGVPAAGEGPGGGAGTQGDQAQQGGGTALPVARLGRTCQATPRQDPPQKTALKTTLSSINHGSLMFVN